jgi:antitoxin (DNA-binding transcriptional repressor) of toxin-antitoxin stability system
MKTIDIRQATDQLHAIARGDISEPTLVTIDGRPVAALLPLDELDRENLSLAKNRDFRRMLDRSRRQVQESGGVSMDDVRRELGIPKQQSGRTAR